MLYADINTSTCISPAPTCPTGYKPDPSNSENCIADCSSNQPTLAEPPLGWKSYLNVYNTSDECKNQALNDSHLYSDFSFSNMTDSRGCLYNACYINEYDPESCINKNNPLTDLPVSYIFDGIASSDSVCSSMVDGVFYLNYMTSPVYNNCDTDNSVYCYLKPGLDNNSSGVTFHDDNNTFSDGTLDSNISFPDINNSNPNINHYDFNSSSQTNNLATQLSNSVRDFIGEFKQSDKYWKKDNQKKFDFRTNNDNSNNQKLLNALNNSKTDTSQVENKLDTLIGNTADQSSQVLSDISNISFTDLNFTSSLDSNFSKSLGSDEISTIVNGSYSDFGEKATAAILDSINNIDYGVLDFFQVSDYNFQDYYLPDVHIMSATFNGKLMDANFLNSLPWNYLKLALLLATLLGSVKYILDRLF